MLATGGRSPHIHAQSCANAIACENALAGNPESEWDVSGVGDTTIQGFATDISVNKGSSIPFKINTPASAYRIDIYRLGWYGGNGARKVASIQPSAKLPQSQPACLTDSATGLVDCGNWAVSASWTVPANAVSGIYIARPVRTDTGGASHIVFIVRDDAGTSNILFQASDTTWQAYNQYGGNSLYLGSAPSADGRAYKVSYNRPFADRSQGGGYGTSNWVFYAEYPMIRWLESNGYDVSYFTDTDADRNGALIRNHRVYLTVGHDEYWSAAQRANIQAARDAGVNLALLTGNTGFWKIRREASIDGSGTAYRTLVSYKETKCECALDPQDPPTWTGTWRDPTLSPPADGGRPENALDGTIFTVNRGTAPIQVTAADGKLRLWRNTSVATLAAGQTATLATDTLGYEWDTDQDNGFQPAGLIRLSTTTVAAPEVIEDYGNTFGPATVTHHMTLYRASSGALVFSAGTVQWVWGLDTDHDTNPDTGSSTPDPRMQQATVNLLADMGVQPTTLQSGLAPASRSTDTTPPSSTVTSPATGTSVTSGSTITISGSAADAGGGVVGGVEVSTDGGTTWHPASGRESWSYTWTAGAPGSVTIKSRATDDSGNIETPSAGVTFTVTPRTCPCSIWPASATPAFASSGDTNAVEVGVKFKADNDGYISAIRFYKGSGNTGTHIGNLWDSSGKLLASATFTNETASGWQQVNLSTPVAVLAGTTYIASYHAPSGDYAVTAGGLLSAMDSWPLHAPASAASGGNGVYIYGASAFPTNSYNGSNYWVDVVYSPSATPFPPAVTAQSPAPNAVKVDTATSVTATFNKPVQPSSINFVLQGPNQATVPASVTYDSSSLTVTLKPNAALAQSTTYTALLSGATDPTSNQTMSPLSWSFTTNGPAPSIWPATATPGTAAVNDPNAIEVGVKFKSDLAGYISGVRFYKGSTNTGPHIGNLWDSSGHLLATATFTSETASGWQQVLFPTPVAISAGTTYIASYHTQSGDYADDGGGLASSVDSYPLHALASGASGGNGVYVYGPSAFPTNSYNASNYWVDVVFATSFQDTVAPSVTSHSPATNASQVALTSTVTATFSEPITPATLSFTLKPTSGGAAVAASVSYDAPSRTATLTPSSALAGGTSYTATVSGAADPSGNVMAPLSWSFTTFTCPCTLWAPGATPAVPAANDPNAIEVGVKFKSDLAGYISGVRFYKGSTNTGPHIGNLWDSSGHLLATATFTSETASGWQQVLFPTPVAISAGTTYIASYHTQSGDYAADGNGLASSVDSYPLHALASGASGGNGVYVYGPSAFPTNSYNASNYWVDVVFATSFQDTVAPSVTSHSPATNASQVALTSTVTATFSEPITPATLSFTLKPTSGGAAVAASVSYDAPSRTATLTPSSALAGGTSYTATVSGAADPSGNVMTPVSWAFTTSSVAPSIWPATATPGTAAVNDPNAIEVGVKFKSDLAGYISGVRFYKGSTNTGPHIGNLWDSSGHLLATATFTSETASGWQQVLFPTPVAISAGTTYIASYHTQSGDYAADGNGLASSVDSYPLHALASAASGGNGVYIYGPSAFPTNSYNASNYWVDVIFSPN